MGWPTAFVALVVLAAFVVPLLGPSLALRGTGEAAAPGAGGIGVLRAVLFAALCVPVGEAYAGWLVRRLPGAPRGRLPPSRVAVATAAGCLAALGLASVVSTGNLVPHRLSDLDLGGLYRSRDGVLALVEINGFLLAGLWARSRRPVSRVLPSAAIIAAEALRAHPATEAAPLAGSMLTAAHLTCATLWVGGLWQVLRTVRLWHGTARPGVPAGPDSMSAAALLRRYARGAAVLLAAVATTGMVSAVRRMPLGTVLDQLTTTAYGRTLLAKVLLVTVAAALALSARLRLRPARPAKARLRPNPAPAATAPLRPGPAPGKPSAPTQKRRRIHRYGSRDPLTTSSPAAAEVTVLGVVVAVSALLTSLPVPIRW
jgi:putative copper export protein